MISTQSITLRYGKRVLFEDVSLKFSDGNCYGIIGANGSGKSTFLRILSGEEDSHTGDVIIPPGERLAVLKQNHFEYNESTALATVIMGHKQLYDIMTERDTIYAKENFSDADGVRASELEEQFGDIGGYEADSEAAVLLEGIGIKESNHQKLLKDLDDSQKIRVLLAQALFGDPDILVLDEPTNHLDVQSITWLEDFLLDFKKTVIVVSHDRHFLNTVCTSIVDIDYSKMSMYVGNYDFWYLSSQLILKQRKDDNKKKEDKIKELKDFVQRFSANASKSKQATSRKKSLEKIQLDQIKPSSRRYPYITFKPERVAGDNVLSVENLKLSVDGDVLFSNVDFRLDKDDKVALISDNPQATTAFMQALAGEIECDEGSITWGSTISTSYFSKDHDVHFDTDGNLIDWLRQYSQDQDEGFIRGFLGRMLFSGEEALKSSKVLSGGEKVRCMLSKMMLSGSNVLFFDEPTSHLDLESITSLNQGLEEFTGAMFITSFDHQLMQTVCNRVIELSSNGINDRKMAYDQFLAIKQKEIEATGK